MKESKRVPRPQWMIDATAGGYGELEGYKRGKNRSRTDDEIAYQGRVAELGCIVCRLLGQYQLTHTEIHHVRRGRLRADCHYDVLPLCWTHHNDGKLGAHGLKLDFKRLGKTEAELLDEVKKLLGETT